MMADMCISAGGLASLSIEIAPGAGPAAFPRSRTCTRLMWLPAYETQVRLRAYICTWTYMHIHVYI